MFGKYFDNRVHRHFVHTYSRVPYLDTEIFNIQTNSLKESRRANQRVVLASQGLERAKEKSEALQNSLRDSRIRREKEAKDFLCTMQQSQNQCLQKQKLVWSRYEQDREESKMNYLKDQTYLNSILKSNSTKASSRLSSVRRWQ